MEQRHLTVRFATVVNDAIRKKTRYKGDISRIIKECIAASNLGRVKIMEITEYTTPTKVTLPTEVWEILDHASSLRKCSINTLLNSVAAEQVHRVK